ncbi:MAG TPA: threonine/serine dehydratase [Candidatus Thermoplasmatota archaeon]|nr:threonine/serine dehydratase [Candidatus Thermoplasmatota archaeon]
MPDPRRLRVTLKDVEEARDRVEGVAFRTPLLPFAAAEGVHLKLESLQRLGSFKIRGAWNRMSRGTDRERERGFLTTSAGNHGQAVAWAARRLGGSCTVYVPEGAVARKVSAMEAMGARVIPLPHREIMEIMTDDRLERPDGPTYVHPFGDPFVVAGAGTVGLEIHEDLPEAATVLVPVGGGGLSLGIARALRELAPRARVYGVQAEGAAPLAASFASGKAERLHAAKTVADGIAASYVFDYMWPLLSESLAGCLAVSDAQILDAMRNVVRDARAVCEPAGAASVAAALANPQLPRPVVCVVSGGNADPALLREVVA